VQASEESEIVGIIRRNDEGLLERCEEANVDLDECVTFIKVSGGLVVVIGPICETDACAIDTMLRDSRLILVPQPVAFAPASLSGGLVNHTSTNFPIQEDL
jgi:hypothetical protein